MSVARYLVTAALVTTREPLNLNDLMEACRAGRQEIVGALLLLTDEGEVEEGTWIEDKPGPQYRLAAGAPPAREDDDELDIDGAVANTFHDFVVHHYRPPPDKRFLVFFQCAVRRPFSKAPSHASMRRAVSVATGFDPAKEFSSCPVHVVVLASRLGPVPYELENLHPANVRSMGVQHFRPETYARIRPVLVRRVADYLEAHGGHYERIATFTAGRYGEVMRDARALAGREFPVFPEKDGPAIVDLAGKRPRSYWEKYWIQLCLEIMRWFPDGEAAARERLSKLGATWE
jgi:hypothetical protein